MGKGHLHNKLLADMDTPRALHNKPQILTDVLSGGNSSLTVSNFSKDVSLIRERMSLGFLSKRRRRADSMLMGKDLS